MEYGFFLKFMLRHYFFLSKIKQKGATICDSTLKEKMNILKLYWSV